MLKHYVQYFSPGSFVSETSDKEIPSRSLDHVLPMKKNSYSYGFLFFDREETKINGEVLKGKKKNYSSTHYIGGRKMNATEVKAEVKNNATLLSNMKINEWKYVVKTKFGQFMPFEKGDIMIA